MSVGAIPYPLRFHILKKNIVLMLRHLITARTVCVLNQIFSSNLEQQFISRYKNSISVKMGEDLNRFVKLQLWEVLAKKMNADCLFV